MNWLVDQNSFRVTRSSSPSIRASAVITYEGERYFCFKSRATGHWTMFTGAEDIKADKLKTLLVVWKLKL